MSSARAGIQRIQLAASYLIVNNLIIYGDECNEYTEQLAKSETVLASASSLGALFTRCFDESRWSRAAGQNSRGESPREFERPFKRCTTRVFPFDCNDQLKR
jgi:hypothetical protein